MSTARLRQDVLERRPILGAAVGSGLGACAAESAGADFLLVLAASHFRLHGVASAASLLPYEDANAVTMNIARTYIMPRVNRIPVIVGACPQSIDDVDGFLADVKSLGIAGVTNFPTVAFHSGASRATLEEAKLGFAAEVHFLRRANQAGLLTIGFCLQAAEATALAKADVDILCFNLGITEWRVQGHRKHQADIDAAVAKVTTLLQAATVNGKTPFALVFGGPVVMPHDTAQIYQRTGALGYIGGSSIERFPTASAIGQAVRDFRFAASPQRRMERLGAMVGASDAMGEVFETIRSVARTDANVLLVGESGTGKELAAREIHRLGARSSQPMVGWNCAATTEGLAMTELFGHDKGAFTGAMRSHIGKFEQAHGGTLFMDEVTELPLTVQGSLLRVIQEREMVRVGGEKPVAVNVRLIAASNRSFEHVIPSGSFRLDLYYRLSTVVLRIPPLRERQGDIPFLVWELLHEFAQKYGSNTPNVPDQVMSLLVSHSWPGNIRELRNTIERVFILGAGKPLQRAWFERMFASEKIVSEHLGQAAPAPPQAQTSLEDWADRRARLADVLKKNHGNKAAAARALGITRKTVHKWLAQGLHHDSKAKAK